MSIKRNKNVDNGIAALAKQVTAEIAERGSAVASREVVGGLVSMESLSDTQHAQIVASLESAESVLADAFADQLSAEQFMDPLHVASQEVRVAEAQRLRAVAMESGAIAALASADPAAYARQAMSLESTAPAGGRLITPMADGPAGAMGYSNMVSAESYDEAELQKYNAHSVSFNTFAARQDAFGEGFFPTIVISADQGGADLAVRRQRVFDGVRRSLTGKETNFGFKNLLSAAVDPSILADQSTRLIPYRDPTVAAPEALLSQDQFGEKLVKVAGADVPTAPYKFGKSIDMIGISGYAPLLGAGILDQTDAVAARAVLSTVYLNGGQDSGTGDDLPVIPFVTAGLHRSAFVGAIEGRDRELNLQFTFNDIIITSATKAVDGSTVAALTGVGTNTVYARATFSGKLDTEFGTLELNASSITVTKVIDNTGVELSLTTGAGKTAKDAVEALGFVGYDVNAWRTNSNRRTPGKRLDVEVIRERYSVLVGPPISVQRPATADGDSAEMEALINAVRLRNSNNAVTQLLNYADLLKTVVTGPNTGRNAEIAGMGRLLVRPFYEELTLDMSASMNSIKSRERAEDVSATLVQALRDLSYRMYQYSEIQAALDSQNPTGSEQPVLLIGTDQILVRHLMLQGDTRTFGTQFQDARIVVSQDERVRHHIFVTFTRNKGLDQLDPLRFGSHLWIPELVSRMPVNRDGGTHLEAMVQSRNLHVNHLPVLGKIKVTNMPKALVDKTLQPAVGTAVTNPWLSGIVFDTSAD